MSTWSIVLIVVGILAFLFILFRRKIIAKVSQPGGVAWRKAAEGIPIYGQFVKVAGVVGKPVNSALDKWTGYHISALNHIPVAGKYLAMPLSYPRKYVKQLNNWLGL